MTSFIYLIFAVIAEVIATTALKVSDGFTKIFPSLVVGVGYFLAFWLMSLTLKTLPVGIVYAIWSGLGIMGISIIGVYYFNEGFGLWHLIGTFFILIGVIILSIITRPH